MARAARAAAEPLPRLHPTTTTLRGIPGACASSPGTAPTASRSAPRCPVPAAAAALTAASCREGRVSGCFASGIPPSRMPTASSARVVAAADGRSGAAPLAGGDTGRLVASGFRTPHPLRPRAIASTSAPHPPALRTRRREFMVSERASSACPCDSPSRRSIQSLCIDCSDTAVNALIMSPCGIPGQEAQLERHQRLRNLAAATSGSHAPADL